MLSVSVFSPSAVTLALIRTRRLQPLQTRTELEAATRTFLWHRLNYYLEFLGDDVRAQVRARVCFRGAYVANMHVHGCAQSAHCASMCVGFSARVVAAQDTVLNVTVPGRSLEPLVRQLAQEDAKALYALCT